MKILFVYPNINTCNGPHYVHGLGSLMSVCQKAGHETSLLYIEKEYSNSRLQNICKKQKPDVVAFSFTTHQMSYVKRMAKVLKTDANITVAGGVHATFAPQQVLESEGIDLVIRGEGEGALLDLLQGHSQETIPNVQTKTTINDCANLIENLDDLPLYDRSDFPMDKILASNAYEMSLMTGRGCPWPCTYCCNHAWKKLYKNKGQFIRLTSHERLFRQIDLLASKYRFESIYFEDDIFTQDQDWVDFFCDEYPKHFSFPFKIYLRVGSVDGDTLLRLYEAGCRWAQIGIESGSEKLRRNTLRRNMTNLEIADTFKRCRELGILTRAFNIIGFPGESIEQMNETILLNEKFEPDQVQVSIFHPYPGTHLYEHCVEHNLYHGEILDNYFMSESVLNQPQLPQNVISDTYRKFCETGNSVERTAFQKAFRKTETLLHNFTYDRIIKAGEEKIEMRRVFIGRESRFCLFAHPRSQIRFPAVMCRNKKFVTELGLDPICLDWGGDGVRFSLQIETSSGSRKIFSKCIDPKHQPKERVWVRWEVVLPNEDDVELTLLTDPFPGDNLTAVWALWAQPRLEDA